MAQFDVHWFSDSYVVDCQSDLVDEFGSRLVVPLLPVGPSPDAVSRLMPVFDVEGEPHIMTTPLAAGVPRRSLGRPVTSLSRQSDKIKAAFDFLLNGF